MNASTVRFLFGAALIASSPLVLVAADSATSGGFSIPAHELNFSPTFAGHPSDLTLLSGPRPATPAPWVSRFAEERDPNASHVSAVELEEARKKLEWAENKLKKLRAEKDAALAKKKALDATSGVLRFQSTFPQTIKFTDPIDARLPAASPSYTPLLPAASDPKRE